MPAGHEAHAPVLDMDVAGIDRPGEQFADTLGMNLAAPIPGPCGLAFEEALDLDRGLEAP